MNVYEQLKAEYEATLVPGNVDIGPHPWARFGPWEIGCETESGRTCHVGPIYGYDYDALEMRADDPAAVWTVSAHERGYPLLMAVFEAAAEMLAAERANAAALAEYRSCVIAQEDILDGYRDRVNSRERFHAAKLALAAALAPLLADAE